MSWQDFKFLNSTCTIRLPAYYKDPGISLISRSLRKSFKYVMSQKPVNLLPSHQIWLTSSWTSPYKIQPHTFLERSKLHDSCLLKHSRTTSVTGGCLLYSLEKGFFLRSKSMNIVATLPHFLEIDALDMTLYLIQGIFFHVDPLTCSLSCWQQFHADRYYPYNPK